MNLSIPNPCPANWEDMIPLGDGRFCNSCQKIVVDFSRMSEEDIKNWFGSKGQHKVCGRLSNKQAPKETFLNKRFYQFSKIAAAASLLIGSMACEKFPFTESKTIGDIVVPEDTSQIAPMDTSAQSEMGTGIYHDSTRN